MLGSDGLFDTNLLPGYLAEVFWSQHETNDDSHDLHVTAYGLWQWTPIYTLQTVAQLSVTYLCTFR